VAVNQAGRPGDWERQARATRQQLAKRFKALATRGTDGPQLLTGLGVSQHIGGPCCRCDACHGESSPTVTKLARGRPAERPANAEAWQLVLSFRSAFCACGRSFWTLYPLEASSKSSLFIQRSASPTTALSQLWPSDGVSETERLRFQDFAFQRLPNGRCSARSCCFVADGRQFTGDPTESSAGRATRCCAEATFGPWSVWCSRSWGSSCWASGGPGVRCRRVIVSLSARRRHAPHACGGRISPNRSTTWRGACGAERDEPHTRISSHAMTRTDRIRLLALLSARWAPR